MNTKKTLAIIPARGGSKGIFNKNLRLLDGKPLIQHAIDYAKSCKLIDKIVVSTDSEDIAAFSITKGVDVIKRPDELAGDQALVIHAIKHAILECEKNYGFQPEIIVLLECTSPIKNVEEIEEAINILLADAADSVASFKETAVSPNRLWRIEGSNVRSFIDDSSPFLPRQSQPKGYELTGQVYAVLTDKLLSDPENTSVLVGKVHPIITKEDVVDIDYEIDLVIAEAIIQYKKTK